MVTLVAVSAMGVILLLRSRKQNQFLGLDLLNVSLPLFLFFPSDPKLLTPLIPLSKGDKTNTLLLKEGWGGF